MGLPGVFMSCAYIKPRVNLAIIISAGTWGWQGFLFLSAQFCKVSFLETGNLVSGSKESRKVKKRFGGETSTPFNIEMDVISMQWVF